MKKIQFPKINIDSEKAKEVALRTSRTAFKTLIGLLAFGLCFEAISGYKSARTAIEDRRRAQKALDERTPATLLDKQFFISSFKSENNEALLYFDMDGNPATAEGIANLVSLEPQKTLELYNITNGTTKSVAQWNRLFGSTRQIQRSR